MGHLFSSPSFPEIKSKNSLVAKYVTEDVWKKLASEETKTSKFTLDKAIACAVQFDNQHCGIYAGDEDSYTVFKDVFDPIIQEYHGISADAKHTSDMDATKIVGKIESPHVKSISISVGRSIAGFGLSPGVTKEERLAVENIMKKAFENLKDKPAGKYDLAGTYYPLTGMDETVRQQLVDDHFLFMSGDPNLKVAGMERDWPEGRGIFHNKDKTFLIWVNEEDHLRIISTEKVDFLKDGDVKGVFCRLSCGIKAVQESIKAESGRDFMLSEKYGYINSCPTNLGTGMRASVQIELPSWTKLGLKVLQARCEELGLQAKVLQARCEELGLQAKVLQAWCEGLRLQARGTRDESGGITRITYDISNKHRLGYSEVQLVQKLIDGVDMLYTEDALLGGY